MPSNISRNHLLTSKPYDDAPSMNHCRDQGCWTSEDAASQRAQGICENAILKWEYQGVMMKGMGRTSSDVDIKHEIWRFAVHITATESY